MEFDLKTLTYKALNELCAYLFNKTIESDEGYEQYNAQWEVASEERQIRDDAEKKRLERLKKRKEKRLAEGGTWKN